MKKTIILFTALALCACNTLIHPQLRNLAAKLSEIINTSDLVSISLNLEKCPGPKLFTTYPFSKRGRPRDEYPQKQADQALLGVHQLAENRQQGGVLHGILLHYLRARLLWHRNRRRPNRKQFIFICLQALHRVQPPLHRVHLHLRMHQVQGWV